MVFIKEKLQHKDMEANGRLHSYTPNYIMSIKKDLSRNSSRNQTQTHRTYIQTQLNALKSVTMVKKIFNDILTKCTSEAIHSE